MNYKYTKQAQAEWVNTTLDIHDNKIEAGDWVYVVTTPRVGSKSKRLFISEVIHITEGGLVTVRCAENGREVNVYGSSIVKPYPRGMYCQ